MEIVPAKSIFGGAVKSMLQSLTAKLPVRHMRRISREMLLAEDFSLPKAHMIDIPINAMDGRLDESILVCRFSF